MKPKPWIVNVGLPRTGTGSFTKAVSLLDLRPLHTWQDAEWNPDILTQFRANDRKYRDYLSQFHAVSDTPFYILRETFEKYYPDTLIVYTTRPRNDWVHSMLKHREAGGIFLARFYRMKRYPFRKSDKIALGWLYDAHHESICHDLPSVDLGCDDDTKKWKLLCSALPNSKEAFERSRQLQWPHENQFRENSG